MASCSRREGYQKRLLALGWCLNGDDWNVCDKPHASPESHKDVTEQVPAVLLQNAKPCAEKQQVDDVLSSIPTKTEFQTKDAYASSVHTILESKFGKPIFEPICYIDVKMRYDAEKGVFTDFLMGEITASKTSTRLDDYKASNAFGATVNVEKSVEVSYGFTFAVENTYLQVDIPIDSAKAEEASKKMRILVHGKVVPPYAVHQDLTGSPTLTYPYDIEKDKHMLVLWPISLTAYNRDTGAIYKVLPTLICDEYGVKRLRLGRCGL